AAGSSILAGAGLRCAGHASDRRIALVVKWVVGHVVVLDVVPDSLVVPVRQRVQLPEPETLVPAELGCVCPGLRIDPADSRDPALGAVERLAHSLNLSDSAAGVRIAAPEVSAIPLLLRLESDSGEAVELDAVVPGERVARLVGFGKQELRVQIKELRP